MDADSEVLQVEVDVKKLSKEVLEQMAVLSSETGDSVPAMFGKALERCCQLISISQRGTVQLSFENSPSLNTNEDAEQSCFS